MINEASISEAYHYLFYQPCIAVVQQLGGTISRPSNGTLTAGYSGAVRTVVQYVHHYSLFIMRLNAYRYLNFYATRIQAVILTIVTLVSASQSLLPFSHPKTFFPSAQPFIHEDGHFHILHSIGVCVALYLSLRLDDPL